MTRTNQPAGGGRRQETGPSGPTRTYGTSVVDFKTPPHRTGIDLSTPFSTADPHPGTSGRAVVTLPTGCALPSLYRLWTPAPSAR